MKLLVGITLCCLLAGNAAARGGGGGGRGMGGGGRGGFRRGFRGSFRRSVFRFGRFNQGLGNGAFSGGFSGGGFFDSDGGYPVDFGVPTSDQTQPGPRVVVVPPPAPPAAPPPPANPVIREYNWPNSDTGSAVFSIVTNDRATHDATSVWIDGSSLRFTTPTGTTGQVERSSVSRDLTLQANPGKNLIAWLP